MGLLEVIFVSPQSEFIFLRCSQLVPIGTRTIRHFNKGYVCMYVCMYVTLDNPKHVLRARQVEKKVFCSPKKMNLFQKTPVFSLSLFFWLHEVSVQDTCISFLFHLLISLFPVIYFDLSITRIPDNSNFFRFTQKVRVMRS